MGRNGYPELFQTGETADGVHPLIDRQHPHNLLMEAAGTYSRNLSENAAVFAYAGIAGEPALGPPAFMHRFPGMENPLAPLGHLWLDATHINDLARVQSVRIGVGGMGTVYRFASALNPSYGAAPASYLLFLRARLYRIAIATTGFGSRDAHEGLQLTRSGAMPRPRA